MDPESRLPHVRALVQRLLLVHQQRILPTSFHKALVDWGVARRADVEGDVHTKREGVVVHSWTRDNRDGMASKDPAIVIETSHPCADAKRRGRGGGGNTRVKRAHRPSRLVPEVEDSGMCRRRRPKLSVLIFDECRPISDVPMMTARESAAYDICISRVHPGRLRAIHRRHCFSSYRMQSLTTSQIVEDYRDGVWCAPMKPNVTDGRPFRGVG